MKMQLLDEKNQHVSITMPSNSEAEEIEMAKLKEDEIYSRIISAVEEGYEEEIRAIVSEFPEFLLTVNSREETLLHLALKYNQVGAFKVLMEELTKRHLDELLINLKDHQGNTVLHIAVSNKLLEIVKLLLPDISTNGAVMLQVNSKNNIGLTPLDVYHTLLPADSISCEIGRILYDAGAVEGSQQQGSQQTDDTVQPPRSLLRGGNRRRLIRDWSMETRNVLLVVLVLFSGAAFNATLNPQAAFLNVQNPANATMFHANEIVTGKLPLSFYYMVFVATIFTVTMGVIAALVWALPFGAILLFAFAMAFIGYVFVVDKTMPKFSVKFGAKSISCSSLAWMCVGAIICCGVWLCSVVKYILTFPKKYFF